MVPPGRIIQNLEVRWFTPLDSWETCVLFFCLHDLTAHGLPVFIAGSGKSVLWFVFRH